MPPSSVLGWTFYFFSKCLLRNTLMDVLLTSSVLFSWQIQAFTNSPFAAWAHTRRAQVQESPGHAPTPFPERDEQEPADHQDARQRDRRLAPDANTFSDTLIAILIRYILVAPILTMCQSVTLRNTHPVLKREDRLGKHPFAGFGTVVEDITGSGYTKNQPILLGAFWENAFFVFLHYKINGSKGVFWP